MARPQIGWGLLLWLVLLGAGPVRAQQDGLLQLNDPLHGFLLRQQAAGRLPGAFLSHQPLSAYAARVYLDTLAARADVLPAVDRALLARYRGAADAPGAAGARRRLGFVYPEGEDLFVVRGDGYALRVNPLVYVDLGAAWDGDATRPSWAWARGARAAGHVTEYLFFETRLTENLEDLAWARYDSAGATSPRHGRISRHGDALGYLTATGVVGLRTNFFEVRLGRDRNRWGPAASSVVLSNYADVYDQLQLRTTVGPFQYVNLFAALTEPRLRPQVEDADYVLPRKYMALHRLAVQLPGHVELGFFESVVFGDDSLGVRRGFDVSYLNPVIFYRAVERDRGSPDNVLLGFDAAWGLRPGLRLYTQFLLDELTVGEVGKGWWGNKWGWIAGVHLADRPLQGLSARLEVARLRPYLYSHYRPTADYVHYNDPLGHPAGPNAVDVALHLDYRPTVRAFVRLDAAYTVRGRNTATENYGADPLLPYTTRVRDHGVYLLQGVRQRHGLLEAAAGYEVLPGFVLEAGLRGERLDDAERGLSYYLMPSLLWRWNMPYASLRN